MSLVDYPLFSWVVVIHSLHVSSFREAHHQEIIFPVQSTSGIVCNLCCSPPVLLRVLMHGTMNVKSIKITCFSNFTHDIVHTP